MSVLLEASASIGILKPEVYTNLTAGHCLLNAMQEIHCMYQSSGLPLNQRASFDGSLKHL